MNKNIKYLVFDIGCLECGEESSIVGVFSNKKNAEKARNKAEEKQKKNWTGQHSFEIFELPDVQDGKGE